RPHGISRQGKVTCSTASHGLAPKLALLATRERGLWNTEVAGRLGVGETVVRAIAKPDTRRPKAPAFLKWSGGWGGSAFNCAKARFARPVRCGVVNHKRVERAAS